jgi:hypothetical protein
MNGIRMPNTLNLYTLAGKIFSLIFAYSSGLALGPEGPFIHIAAMMASGLSGGRILRRISFFFSKTSDTHSVEAFLSFPEPSEKVPLSFSPPLPHLLLNFLLLFRP